MTSILAWLGGGLGVIFFLLIGIIQIIVGYLGIEYHLGSGWAIGCIIASFLFRITFPLTIGTFFGALDVLGWPWYGAALFTLPGLIFIIPGAVGIALAGIGNMFGNKSSKNNYSNNYEYNDEEPKDVTPTKKVLKKVKKVKKVAKKSKKRKAK